MATDKEFYNPSPFSNESGDNTDGLSRQDLFSGSGLDRQYPTPERDEIQRLQSMLDNTEDELFILAGIVRLYQGSPEEMARAAQALREQSELIDETARRKIAELEEEANRRDKWHQTRGSQTLLDEIYGDTYPLDRSDE